MRSRSVALVVVLFLGISHPLSSQQRRPQPRSGTVDIVAAIVTGEMQVRPVPLLTLEVWQQRDTSSKTSLRTGLDGHSTLTIVPGAYRLRSAKTPAVDGRAYSWLVDFEVAPGKSSRLELTNANAQIDSSVSVVRAPAREIAPEIALYEKIRTGVLQIRADLWSGSGFILDTLDGVLVTNAHVVSNADEVSVVLPSGIRVPASVLAKSTEADIAVLRLPRSACDSCRRFRIVRPDATGQIVVPGERVVAIGFPLGQHSTVTVGIVSSVRERAIMSDVNINEGNSGGPLVNMQGDVVAINTFGVPSSKGGPGLGGSILINQLLPLLDSARKVDLHTPLPVLAALPMLGTQLYPMATMVAAADSASFDEYKKYGEVRFGDFVLATSTTLSNVVTSRMIEETVASDRRKREARAGLTKDQRFSESAEYHDWMEYVGNELTPAVRIQVTPRAGETSGSSWGRAFAALAGASTRAKFEFKGDVQAVHWFRNGEPLTPVIGGRTPQVVFENNLWVSMNDVAYRGLYVFSPEAFAPDTNGGPPSIVLQIDDLKHYDRFILRELPADLVARIWNDFRSYYRLTKPENRFVVADAALFASPFTRLCDRSPLCSGFESLHRTVRLPEARNTGF